MSYLAVYVVGFLATFFVMARWATDGATGFNAVAPSFLVALFWPGFLGFLIVVVLPIMALYDLCRIGKP